MRHRWLTLLVVMAFAGTANAQKPQIQWDPAFDFDSIQTFGFESSGETSLEESDPFMHSRVMTALEYQLTSAGLTLVDENPDIWVTYHTESRDRTRLQSSSFGYGFGGYGLGTWDHWGYGFGGPTTTTTRVIEYEENSLIVDIWDPESEELVFRGTVARVFSQSPQKAEKQIDRAIDRMARQAEKLISGGR